MNSLFMCSSPNEMLKILSKSRIEYIYSLQIRANINQLSFSKISESKQQRLLWSIHKLSFYCLCNYVMHDDL